MSYFRVISWIVNRNVYENFSRFSFLLVWPEFYGQKDHLIHIFLKHFSNCFNFLINQLSIYNFEYALWIDNFPGLTFATFQFWKHGKSWTCIIANSLRIHIIFKAGVPEKYLQEYYSNVVGMFRGVKKDWKKVLKLLVWIFMLCLLGWSPGSSKLKSNNNWFWKYNNF